MLHLRETVFDEFDLLFKNLFDTSSKFTSVVGFDRDNFIKYPVDIKKTEKSLQFDIAVVDANEDDINIDVEDDILRVKYNRPIEEKEDSTEWIFKSISRKNFNFAWKISAKYDLKSISAKLDKGLLKIEIPLAPEAEPKKIKIQVTK